MKIELKDVINFYLGCEVITEKGTIWTLEPSNFPSNWQSSYFLNSKPLLRPLSDLTKEEAILKIRVNLECMDRKDVCPRIRYF